MPTARKKETVKELNQLFNQSQVLIFTDYRGLRVSDLNTCAANCATRALSTISPRTR